jgi:hypothetical protein
MAANFKFRIEVNGARQKINALGRGANDKSTLQAIGTRVLDFIDRQFATAGGGKWRPLAPSTIRKKGHSRILFERGKLIKSWRMRTSSGYSVSVYSEDPKAIFHEEGTSRMPARPMLPNEAEAKALAAEAAIVVKKRMLMGTGGT